MMGDKQVEEYLGVLEPILSQVVVTENSWRDRVMPEELEKIAVQVFRPRPCHPRGQPARRHPESGRHGGRRG